MRFGIIGSVIVVASLVVACGGGSGNAGTNAGPSPTGSLMLQTCNSTATPVGPSRSSCSMHLPDGDYCADKTGTDGDDEEKSKQLCGIMKGTYSKSPCKTEGVVGRCLVQCGKPMEAINTVYYGKAEDMAAGCIKQHGAPQK